MADPRSQAPTKFTVSVMFSLSMLILWKPTLVVIFKDYLYATDLTTVFLQDSCIGTDRQTVFAFCLIEILVACVLLRGYVVPAFFGETMWKSYDDLKQRKLVGFIVKIMVRISCLVQLFVLVAPRFSMNLGLFAEFNVKAANKELVENKIVTTCAESGMTLRDAAAMRAWTFTRDDMMAVMVWELAFIPELPADAWVHHIFVILGVALGSDPQILGSNAALQPLIDGNAFFLVLGAALAAGVESAVVMYHLSASDASKQALWMIRSIAVQTTLVLVLFLALPLTLVFMHTEQAGWLVAGICAVLALLSGVEAKMIIVKWSIVKHARRKAMQINITVARAADLEGRSQPLVSLSVPESSPRHGSHGSFHHDMSKEIEACSAEDEIGTQLPEGMNQAIDDVGISAR